MRALAQKCVAVCIIICFVQYWALHTDSLQPAPSSYEGEQCTQRCILHQILKKTAIEGIKQKILNEMEMTSPPVSTQDLKSSVTSVFDSHKESQLNPDEDFDEYENSKPVPRSLGEEDSVQNLDAGIEEYAENSKLVSRSNIFEDGDEDEDKHDVLVDVQKVIALAVKSTKVPEPISNYPVQWFDFGDIPYNHDVVTANLNFFIDGTQQGEADDQSKVSKVHIEVLNVIDSPPYLKPIYDVYTLSPPAEGSFVELNITEVVTKWFARPEESLGIVVRATDDQGRNVLDPAGKYTMTVVVTTSGKKNHRIERVETLDCESDSEDEECCRHSFEVDFKQIGWDWVVEPKTFTAYFCDGKCSSVKSTYSDPNGNVGNTCCLPRKLSGYINLQYFQGDKKIYKTVPNTFVESCGCY